MWLENWNACREPHIQNNNHNNNKQLPKQTSLAPQKNQGKQNTEPKVRKNWVTSGSSTEQGTKTESKLGVGVFSCPPLRWHQQPAEVKNPAPYNQTRRRNPTTIKHSTGRRRRRRRWWWWWWNSNEEQQTNQCKKRKHKNKTEPNNTRRTMITSAQNQNSKMIPAKTIKRGKVYRS